jgi:hypothetical protein
MTNIANQSYVELHAVMAEAVKQATYAYQFASSSYTYEALRACRRALAKVERLIEDEEVRS